MSHEHDTPPDGSANAVAEPNAPEPDYIVRARRILSGDVRPDDYLAVTPEIEEYVAFAVAHLTEHVRQQFEARRIPAMFELDPCIAIQQRNMRLLSVHYGGQIIVSSERDEGVIVLAVGLENCAALLNTLPYEVVRQFRLGMYAPEYPDVISMY